MGKLNLILVDRNVELCQEWKSVFAPHKTVSVFRGFFEKLKSYDCIVSPANSFGLMDGGIDLALTQFFGTGLMARVQAQILQKFGGEQPVGTAIIVETGHVEFPFLAHAPTMRVPADIRGTDHVYRAMLAVLCAIRRHNETSDQKIRTVACPGLGTGTGNVPVKSAASQMELAWRNFLSPPVEMDWAYARARQAEIQRAVSS